ncbi:hypothetical protein L7F22_023290 [Adiantum nelumboides]|nr:hypothetical protein [Adiantum nelumboides]
MVKKSKKSKSKRVPLRKKYKILKKVKEHHKKKAKEAKKLGKRKNPVMKDPGIPNAWPFKEQELQALEARRARALEEMELKKQAKKERAEKRKLGLISEGEVGLTDLAQLAAGRTSEFDKRSKSTKDGLTTRDGSQRSFYRELLKVIEASDVIIEVLDARDPLGSRCKDVERLVMTAVPTKHLILLLNKIDLVPKEVAEKWLNYLREELPTVAFKCSTQQQRAHLGQKRSSKVANGGGSTSECLGAETLLQLLKNYSRNNKLKTAITVGVIGLPNAGKSSLINSMKRTRVVSVGSTAGITKVMQDVQLDKHVKLLDCPGVVMAMASENDVAAVLRNAKRIENLDDPFGPVKEIVKLCPQEKIMSIYKIPRFQSPDDFLQQVAQVRGKLKKGGGLDLVAAGKLILKDWNQGKIPHYCMPPARPQYVQEDTAILSEFSKEFNVEDVYRDERSTVISSLSSLVDSVHFELPPNAPVSMEVPDSKMDDEESDEEDQPAETLGEASDDMDLSEHLVASIKERSAISSQNEKLYNVEAILNPRVARAERKRRKKASRAAEKNDDSGSDYDFEVDYKEDQDANGVESMTGIQ